MGPFGETVLAWRLVRQMTQAQLARAARVPRPNLSAIERGDREVTLKTLRALALALDVTPGTLVDGEMPGGRMPPMTRTRLERISRAVVSGRLLADPRERTLVAQLATVMSSRRRAATGASAARQGARTVYHAYLLLKGTMDSHTLASLIERISGFDRARQPRERVPR